MSRVGRLPMIGGPITTDRHHCGLEVEAFWSTELAAFKAYAERTRARRRL